MTNRAHDIQSLFEGNVIFHLDGYQGAGKTTTMMRLQKEFPSIILEKR